MTIEARNFTTDKALREQYVDRMDVLDRVKEAPSFLGMEFSTKKQIAKYFEVSQSLLSNLISKHMNEFISDGYKTLIGQEILDSVNEATLQKSRLFQRKNRLIVEHSAGTTTLAIGRNGIFPKRAVLRIAMLLKHNEVAEKVREELIVTENALQEMKQNTKQDKTRNLSVDIDLATWKLLNMQAVMEDKKLEEVIQSITMYYMTHNEKSVLRWNK